MLRTAPPAGGCRARVAPPCSTCSAPTQPAAHHRGANSECRGQGETGRERASEREHELCEHARYYRRLRNPNRHPGARCGTALMRDTAPRHREAQRGTHTAIARERETGKREDPTVSANTCAVHSACVRSPSLFSSPCLRRPAGPCRVSSGVWPTGRRCSASP